MTITSLVTGGAGLSSLTTGPTRTQRSFTTGPARPHPDEANGRERQRSFATAALVSSQTRGNSSHARAAPARSTPVSTP